MSTKEKKIVYITKYALTNGIEKREVDIITFPDKIVKMCSYQGYNINYFHDNDFHYTEEEAIKDFEKRKEAKIKALNKSLKKVTDMKFTFKEVK